MAIRKTLTSIVLAGTLALGTAGCGKNPDNKENIPSQYKPVISSNQKDTSKTTNDSTKYKPVYSKTINEFGVTTYQDPYQKGWYERTSVAVADMDSDGDLDVIVSNAFGEVIVLENKIPQKK